MTSPSLHDLRHALNLTGFDPRQAQVAMSPSPRPFEREDNRAGQARVGSVLALFYPSAGASGGLTFVLTRRTETLSNHSGQISFPGGSQDAGETLEETALREAREELGVDTSQIELLGKLLKVYIYPSDFEVFPYVAYTSRRPVFKANPHEVDEVIEMPMAALLDDSLKDTEPRTFQDITLDIPFYRFNGHKIWGATAIMLSELEHRLKRVANNQHE